MKFPKLNLVCSDDDLRPVMSHIKVEPEFTFATDAHILVRHKTSEIFKKDFVASIPEEGILIPKKAIFLMCKKTTVKISLTEDKKQIQLHQIDGSVITYNLFFDGNYPNANLIIPDPKDCKPLVKVGLNSVLLSRLASGMNCNDPILNLLFFDQNKGVYATSPHSDYYSAVGIIMPVMIND